MTTGRSGERVKRVPPAGESGARKMPLLQPAHAGGIPRRRLFTSLLLAVWPALLNAAPALFVEATITPNPVDVAAQTVYTLRFFQAVDFQQLHHRPPQARLAEIRPLDAAPDAPLRYSERVIDGKRYRVYERHYAVLPIASGALAIGGAAVSGRDASGKSIELPAPELTLTVEAAPPASAWPTGASWLPARRVELREEDASVATGTRVLKLGEALTRTLHIEAEGIDAAALPDLAVDTPGWRVHADAPQLANRVVGHAMVGARSQRLHWVATSGGSLALPALGIDWWNVEARAWRRSELPGATVTVLGPVAPNAGTDSPADRRTAKTPHDIWLIALVALSALLSGWAALRRDRLRFAWRRWQAKRRLLEACQRHAAADAREALMAWASVRWPDATLRSTADVTSCLPAAAPVIGHLDTALYGHPMTRWRGEGLAAAIRSVSIR
jgi:hypothetical protein